MLSGALHINPENLHHAYAISGNKESILSGIVSFIEKKLKINTRGNPDVLVLDYETLGIDEGRELKEYSRHTPLGEKKLFVISFSTITLEAQNSLLKLFEEPTPQTHFFLILPKKELLLPTLRSRVFLIENIDESKSEIDVKDFLSGTAGERQTMLKRLFEDKDKLATEKFLNNLETFLYNSQTKEKSYSFALEEIIKMRGYLASRASSVKMILDHLSAITPQV
jgi:hypothetical protein